MYELSLSFCHKHPESSHSEKRSHGQQRFSATEPPHPQDKEFINVLGISYNASLTHLLSLRLFDAKEKGVGVTGGPVAGARKLC